MTRPTRCLAILALAASAGAIAASAALAADIPVRKAPAAVLAHNWSGLYVGVHAGYGWNTEDVSLFPAGGLAPALFAAGVVPAALDTEARGFLAGGQIGYNWQFAPNWVFGLEADASWADIEGSSSVTNTVPPFITFTSAASQQLDIFGTVRARFGYSWDRTMLYATGGLAYGRAELNTSIFTPGLLAPAGLTALASTRDWLTGWTIGAGLEHAFSGNWSLKAEYLYYDLGDITHTVFDPLGAAGAPVFGATGEFKGHIFRFGINYRFAAHGP